MNFLTTGAAVLSFLENAPAEGQVLITTIESAVSLVEKTTMTGEAKLTAVLNMTSGAASSLAPGLITDFEALMAAVEQFVNDLVAAYNSAGLFVKAVSAIV